jgi:hypothetical protein
MGRCGLDLSDLALRPVESFCKHGNERSGSIKYLEFLE